MEITCTGMWRVRGLRLRRSRMLQPSTTGSWMSRVIAAGSSSFARASPVSPRLRACRLVFYLGLRSDIRIGQVEGERAPLSRLALHHDLAAEQAGDLARDGKAQAGAAVLAAGGPVRLLERLEDDLLLVAGDADARVGHREPEHGVRPVQDVRLEVGAIRRRLHQQADAAVLRELEGVRKQVLEHLLQALRIGADVRGEAFAQLDPE